MGRIPKSNRRLVAAIMAAFRDPGTLSVENFGVFSPADWYTTETWLDTSGLAFYWLDLVRRQSKKDILPVDTLGRLENKYLRNEQRMFSMAAELLRVNRLFTAAGLSFLNVKGITFSPLSCPEPRLRQQSDLDFLVETEDMPAAVEILLANGYRLTGANPQSFEFKDDGRVMWVVDSQYDPDVERSIELHLPVAEWSEAFRNRSSFDLRVLFPEGDAPEGLPCLNGPEQFVQQALHLLHHLREECTKASWLVEFRNHQLARSGDRTFYSEVLRRIQLDPFAQLALALATRVTNDLVGETPAFPLPELNALRIPPLIQAWSDQFGAASVLADAPGTKLYLFLNSALASSGYDVDKAALLNRFLPLQLPATVSIENKHATRRGWKMRIYRVLFRLRFHLSRNTMVLLALPRWLLATLPLKAGAQGPLLKTAQQADSKGVVRCGEK